ncbi:hypothetical protein CMI40_00490 [Candidatus Pacearchaeota archaeon]|jgi:hypothetical protein|nr:hypothetical protein [Candidatus Pacearchaeota archaeon]|tara:strand:- start:13116 stop:13820 length:705 start_codon:yes stop_codon:yes gene_type:complete
MVGEYFEEDAISPYQSRYKLKLFVFIVFVGIILLLVYTSFSGNFPLTGKAIVENITVDRIKFNADLTIPHLKLDNKIESLRIKGSSNSFFYVGDQKFNLEDLENNYIVLIDYDGKIYFDKANIFEFSGKVNKTIINGIPITSKSGKDTKVYFDGNFSYDLLEINGDVPIRRLSYVTSGKINLNKGKNIFDIDNEEVIIDSFIGDLELNRRKFNMDGYVKGLNVVGDSAISIGMN